MMQSESLFLKMFDELQDAVFSDDEYRILRSSHIIRQLFLDGQKSVWDLVNRSRHFALSFAVAQHSIALPIKPAIWMSFAELDPRSAPKHWIRSNLKRDAFLRLHVATVDGHDYSVKDLVLYVAHVMGGVHSGSTTSEKEKALASLQALKIFSNINSALLLVRAIGKNIPTSLQPMVELLLNSKKFETQPGFSAFFCLELKQWSNRENYIVDVGIDGDRNRLSLYINSEDEMCVRYIDSNSRRSIVKLGKAGWAFSYGSVGYLALELAECENECLIRIGNDRLTRVEVVPNLSLLDPSMNFVVGSDVYGKAETHMNLVEWMVYSTILSPVDKGKLLQHLTRSRSGQSVYFKGNQFLHSKNHPNFGTAENTEKNDKID